MVADSGDLDTDRAARQQAWDQTYGRHRLKKNKHLHDDPIAILPSKASHITGADELTCNSARVFIPTPVSLRTDAQTQGVYVIYHAPTARYYVGSSVDICARLKRHFYDLRNERHHSAKLQAAWKSHHDELRFGIAEPVTDSLELRVREQAWIDRLNAFGQGFNSKSVADGPEISLESHIVSALTNHWPKIYEPLAPNPNDFRPNTTDRKFFQRELRECLSSKAAHVGVATLLIALGVEVPALRILWLGLLFYSAPIIFFSWPTWPKGRARTRYELAVEAARSAADTQLISLLSFRLGTPAETVRTAYADAPQVVADRKARQDMYRRNPYLRARARMNRHYWSRRRQRRRGII